MKLSTLSVEDFLKAEMDARETPEAKKAFEILNVRIERAPTVQERLALDFLTNLEMALNREKPLKGWISYLLRFEEAISRPRRPEYLARLQRVVEAAFDQLANPQEHRGRQLALKLTFGCGMISLKKHDADLFRVVKAYLEEAAGPSDFRTKLLNEVVEGTETGHFRLSPFDNRK